MFGPEGGEGNNRSESVKTKSCGAPLYVQLEGLTYARISFTTFPCTSVSRKSRPWNL